MSQMALQILVGTALTDPKFRHNLLDGRRHSLLTEFDLTDKEREAVLVIEAESIQQFAARLCEWLEAQEGITARHGFGSALPASAIASGARVLALDSLRGNTSISTGEGVRILEMSE